MDIVTIDFETYYDREYSLSKITTEAYVRNGSDVRALDGLMKVEAHDRVDAEADVNALAVSGGLAAFAAGVALAENTISSVTTASVEDSTVESGAGDLFLHRP